MARYSWPDHLDEENDGNRPSDTASTGAQGIDEVIDPLALLVTVFFGHDGIHGPGAMDAMTMTARRRRLRRFVSTPP